MNIKKRKHKSSRSSRNALSGSQNFKGRIRVEKSVKVARTALVEELAARERHVDMAQRNANFIFRDG